MWSEYTPNRDFSRSKNNKYIIYVFRFEIDPLTADIRLRNCSIPGTGNCLDYEAVRQYNLTLIAAGMLNMVLYHNLSGLFFNCFHKNSPSSDLRLEKYMFSHFSSNYVGAMDTLIMF